MYNGSMLFNIVTPYIYAPLDVSVCHTATQDMLPQMWLGAT